MGKRKLFFIAVIWVFTSTHTVAFAQTAPTETKTPIYYRENGNTYLYGYRDSSGRVVEHLQTERNEGTWNAFLDVFGRADYHTVHQKVSVYQAANNKDQFIIDGKPVPKSSAIIVESKNQVHLADTVVNRDRTSTLTDKSGKILETKVYPAAQPKLASDFPIEPNSSPQANPNFNRPNDSANYSDEGYGVKISQTGPERTPTSTTQTSVTPRYEKDSYGRYWIVD